MERKKPSLWEILVPQQSNDGSEISIEHHQQWDEQIKEISGGLTIFKPAKGNWISPTGDYFVEPMIPVRIMATKKQMKSIVVLTASHYDQLAVMYYRLTKKVKVKEFLKT